MAFSADRYHYSYIQVDTADGAQANVELTVYMSDSGKHSSEDAVGEACEKVLMRVTHVRTVEDLIGHRETYEKDIANELHLVVNVDHITINSLSIKENFR